MTNEKEISPVISLPPVASQLPGNINSAKAQQILSANGLQVNEQQAKAITEFLYTLAQLTTQHDHS